MYAAQGSQHPTPPAQTLPQAGTPPLRDRLGAEQLQGREEDVAGVRALASRHQRVGGGFTPRSARGSADPPQAKGPALLRKSLHSTNPIESMFSMVRSCERNIKRYRNSKMRQRWLAAVLLHCERRFRRVKGYASIDTVVAAIDAIQRRDRNARGRVSSGRKSGT